MKRLIQYFCLALHLSWGMVLGDDAAPSPSINFFNISTLASTQNGAPLPSAVINTSHVWTGMKSVGSVLCQTLDARPISHCLWTRSAEARPDDITRRFNITSEDSLPVGFAYFGNGLENGDCGITIEAVGQNEVGFWNCVLISDKPDVFVGRVQVSIWEPPAFKPTIQNKEQFKKILDSTAGITQPIKLNASCCALGGKPDPVIYFQIGNAGVDPVNDTIPQIYTRSSENELCVTWVDAEFNYTMNRKNLYCVMDHVSFTENESVHSDSVELDIEFAPIFLGPQEKDVISVDIDSNAKSFDITVAVRGNPLPEISWLLSSLDGEKRRKNTPVGMNSNYALTGSKTGDQVKQKLTIVDVSLLQVNESVTVYVNNYHGQRERRYEFTVSESPGYLIYILVAIGVASLILVIVGAALIFWFRTQKRSQLYTVKPKGKERTPTAVGKRSETGDSEKEVEKVAIRNRAKDEVATAVDETDKSLIKSPFSPTSPSISMPIPIPSPSSAPPPPALTISPPARPSSTVSFTKEKGEVITKV